MLKEIKGDTKKWKDIPCSWIGKTNIVKMFILPKGIYRFNAISIKIPRTFFTEIKEKFLKYIWSYKRPRIGKLILKKEEQCWRYHTPWFQTILQTIVMVLATWYWQNSMVLAKKKRYVDQCNRIEIPEINPRICGQLICNKGTKNIQLIKDSLFNNWCWEN